MCQKYLGKLLFNSIACLSFQVCATRCHTPASTGPLGVGGVCLNGTISAFQECHLCLELDSSHHSQRPFVFSPKNPGP